MYVCVFVYVCACTRVCVVDFKGTLPNGQDLPKQMNAKVKKSSFKSSEECVNTKTYITKEIVSMVSPNVERLG